MGMDEETGMMALEYPRTEEAAIITKGSIKFNPLTTILENWQGLVKLPPQPEIPEKKVGAWAWITGDNPFLFITSGGSMLPMPDRPGEGHEYKEVVTLYSKAQQAALLARGVTPARKAGDLKVSTMVQITLAGISALSALLVVAALLPRILEQY